MTREEKIRRIEAARDRALGETGKGSGIEYLRASAIDLAVMEEWDRIKAEEAAEKSP